MDLYALGLDVPRERELLIEVPEPVGLGPDYEVVIDAVGVVVAVAQLPRVPCRDRGVSDEHQHVDIAPWSGVAPAFEPYTASRLSSPAGLLQSVDPAGRGR